MEFWRTLFHRDHLSSRPSQQVAPILPAIPYVPPALPALPTFQALVFSSTNFTHGTPSSGTINNATTGSVIVAVGLPVGLTINSALRTWAWDGTGIAATGSFTLYENIPGSAGNPNISTITYAITGGASAALIFSIAANSQYVPVISF